jgi:hypothetical protein
MERALGLAVESEVGIIHPTLAGKSPHPEEARCDRGAPGREHDTDSLTGARLSGALIDLPKGVHLSAPLRICPDWQLAGQRLRWLRSASHVNLKVCCFYAGTRREVTFHRFGLLASHALDLLRQVRHVDRGPVLRPQRLRLGWGSGRHVGVVVR